MRSSVRKSHRSQHWEDKILLLINVVATLICSDRVSWRNRAIVSCSEGVGCNFLIPRNRYAYLFK